MSEQSHLEIGGMRGPDKRFYPVEYDPESELNEDLPNYEIRAIKYRPRVQDGLENVGELVDGALFSIHPNKPNDAQRITEPGYVAKRQRVEGSGVALILRKGGTVDEYRLGVEGPATGQIIELREGDIDCWIAGPSGLKVLDISEPNSSLISKNRYD